MTNEEIAKAISESNLGGGLLNAEQQERFIDLVFDYSKMNGMVRQERVDNPKGELGKLFIGEPITRAASVNPTSGEAKPKTNKVSYETSKVMSWYDLPTDVLFRNIAKEDFEDQWFEAVTKRIATDLELLNIRGDISTYSGVNTPIGYLLRVLDGWGLQTEEAHIFDAGGASVQTGIFARMIRMLPEQYKGDPNLRWIMSESTYQDWLDVVAQRATMAGDEALKGNALAPYGIPIERVPLIPTNLDVTVTGVTAAFALGNRQGPFVFDSSANKMTLDIDNAGAVTVTFPDGTLTVSQVAKYINDAVGAHVARNSGFGQLLIESQTTGASSEVDIQAVANDAYSVLGLSVGVDTGSAAGTADTTPEGTFLWLANPMNFIHIMLNQTRVFQQFEPREDALQVTIYNEVDATIENTDSIVKAVNLRQRELV